MPTDKERREVARRLREMGEELGSSVLLWYYIAKILGVRTATDGKTACDMLADLLDPGELKTTCIAEVKIEGEKLDEAVNRAIAEYTGIDRDALLELADEIHGLVENQEIRFFHVVQVHESTLATIERRIREACGEGER